MKLGIVSQIDSIMRHVASLRTYQRGFESQMQLNPAIKYDALKRHFEPFHELESWLFEVGSFPEKVFRLPEHLYKRLDIYSPVSQGDVIRRSIFRYIDGLPAFREYWDENIKLPFKRFSPNPKTLRIKQKNYEILKEVRSNARIQEHRFRLACAVLSRPQSYFVFNSLTVDDGHYGEVFRKKSRCFSNFIRKIDKVLGCAHEYYAVVERGGLNNRLHLHCLHIFDDLPDNFKRCPNFGKKTFPKNREIYNMKAFWKYGHSSPIACRFGPDDSFGRLGWRWPVKKDGSPLDNKGVGALINYLVKYITKNLVENSNSEDKRRWLTKMRRNFGMETLVKAVEKIPLYQKLMIVYYPQEVIPLIQPPQILIPTRLLEKMASRSILKHMTIGPHRMNYLRELAPLKDSGSLLADLIQRSLGCNLKNSPFVSPTGLKGSDVYNVKRLLEKEFSFFDCQYVLNLKGSSM